MSDFNLKIILTIFSGVIFSFIFIILALTLPVEKKKEHIVIKKPTNRLEKISNSFNDD